VALRPLRVRDGPAWRAVRERNRDWLRPWEATSPDGSVDVPSFRSMVRRLQREARLGLTMPFVVTYEGPLVGQLNVGGITWGSFRSAHVGYWIDQAYAGRGIMPLSLALVTDHLLLRTGLHRVEVNIRPENTASVRVVEKLGYRDEGLRLRMLHIDGDWRDHRSFALTVEELPPDGLVAAWRARSHSGP